MHAGPEGLTEAEARRRLERSGPNRFQVHRERALILQLLSRFNNPLVIILLAASAISAFTGDQRSFVIISIIVSLSVLLDFIQEYRAGRAVKRLQQRVALQAATLRDGQIRELPMAELAPGDVVALAVGNLVPGDGGARGQVLFFVMKP